MNHLSNLQYAMLKGSYRVIQTIPEQYSEDILL